MATPAADFSSSSINSGGHINSHNTGVHNQTFNINQALAAPARDAPAPRCPLPSPNFVGRTHELEQLNRFFFGADVPANQRLVFVVIGMGGCGKTQLVRKFMHSIVYSRSKTTPSSDFYVDATTPSTLHASLASIAKANGYGDSSEAALAWMSRLKQPFFLYIDNADDPGMDLHEFFPNSNHARIIITTRVRDAEQNYGTGSDSAIRLDPLKQREAVDLLRRSSRMKFEGAEEETATTLVQDELHLHALAIVQAGAAMFKMQWTIDEYLARFCQLQTRLMDGTNDGVGSRALDNYPAHVYTTWKLSYDRLSDSASQLLGICAYLHHTGITEELFARAFLGIYNPGIGDDHLLLLNPPTPFTAEEPQALALLNFFVADGAWNNDAFRRCIQEVCSLSLLSYDQTSRAYSIHPLIHDCLRSVASHPSRTAFLLSATVAPIENDAPLIIPLLPHVHRVLLSWTAWKMYISALHPLLARFLGQVLYYAGHHDEAVQLHRTSLEGFVEKLGTAHQLAFIARHDLALTLAVAGQSKEAEQLLREVLDDWRDRLGQEHPDTITALASLAQTLRCTGSYEEAERYLRVVLENRQTNLGLEHRDTIWTMRELALTQCNMCRFEDAEGIGTEAWEHSQRAFGEEHLHTSRSVYTLGLVIAQSGRHAEAVPLLRRAVEQLSRLLGPSDPNTRSAEKDLQRTLQRMEEPSTFDQIDLPAHPDDFAHDISAETPSSSTPASSGSPNSSHGIVPASASTTPPSTTFGADPEIPESGSRHSSFSPIVSSPPESRPSSQHEASSYASHLSRTSTPAHAGDSPKYIPKAWTAVFTYGRPHLLWRRDDSRV